MLSAALRCAHDCRAELLDPAPAPGCSWPPSVDSTGNGNVFCGHSHLLRAMPSGSDAQDGLIRKYSQKLFSPGVAQLASGRFIYLFFLTCFFIWEVLGGDIPSFRPSLPSSLLILTPCLTPPVLASDRNTHGSSCPRNPFICAFAHSLARWRFFFFAHKAEPKPDAHPGEQLGPPTPHRPPNVLIFMWWNRSS